MTFWTWWCAEEKLHFTPARPALSCGRLTAFKKCTSGVACSKGRQNLESVRLTVQEKQYFTPFLTCSNLVKTFHTCFLLFTPFHNCSQLFTPVPTCSHLFTTVRTCSHLFTPVHICSHLSDYLRSLFNGSFLLFFPLRKLLLFDLTCHLVEIAYFCSPN